MTKPAITNKGVVQVTALTCNRCGDTIYSTHRHDFKYCICDRFFIDGGFDYVRSNIAIGGTFMMNVQLEEGVIANWKWPQNAGLIPGPWHKRMGYAMAKACRMRLQQAGELLGGRE